MLAAAALTAALTYPIAFKIGRVGRVDNGDGQFSIWNVAWVARTLVVDPLHVFDANIFYPHRGTLAYSENNLGAGALAVPVYWATRNPYAAHNFVVLLAFVLSATGMYYLVRYLTQRSARGGGLRDRLRVLSVRVRAHGAHPAADDRRPAVHACWHSTAWPIGPTPAAAPRSARAMAAQAICCGYYGVFVVLMVGFAVLGRRDTARLWRTVVTGWRLPSARSSRCCSCCRRSCPYITLQQVGGFRRELKDAIRTRPTGATTWRARRTRTRGCSATCRAWTEVSFPGFVVAGSSALCGAVIAVRGSPRRELLALYGGLTLLAFWASFGPQGLLYSVLYHVVPMFAWLRAPARFGLIVGFGLSVLAGVALAPLAPTGPTIRRC